MLACAVMRWVLLVYRLPRDPSTPRIGLWRQLRRLGVVQVADGVVALPLDARSREQLEWLADEVIEQDGEATIWVGEPGSRAQEATLARRMAEAVSAEYTSLIAEASAAAAAPDAARGRTLARLRRELRRIGLRDYFPGPSARHARGAVEALARQVEAAS